MMIVRDWPAALQQPGYRCSLSIRGVSMAIACLAMASLFFSAAPQMAAAQEEVRETVGDWQVRCGTPPGAPSEQCAIVQSVTAQDRENVGLDVAVLRTADKKDELMRVRAPLGVLLPTGLGLIIDEQEVGRTAFTRCVPVGCYAEVFMDAKLVGQLKGGSQALFIIFQTPEEGIGIPVSLNGFTAAFEKIVP